ncbi:hypothetical protein [Terribacillus sp. JSM ZJ617]|uniref:hypothetical protein n=1 Tax=Terribacillus sp. JSM ZJ617 TaxID=3342119 RepID=UPI0035A92792
MDIQKLNEIRASLVAYQEDGSHNKYLGRYVDAEEIIEIVDLLNVYRNALIFYAAEGTYCFDKWGSPIQRDSGNYARKALSLEENKE